MYISKTKERKKRNTQGDRQECFICRPFWHYCKLGWYSASSSTRIDMIWGTSGRNSTTLWMKEVIHESSWPFIYFDKFVGESPPPPPTPPRGRRPCYLDIILYLISSGNRSAYSCDGRPRQCGVISDVNERRVLPRRRGIPLHWLRHHAGPQGSSHIDRDAREVNSGSSLSGSSP